jgi:hypothetical protein
MMHDATLTIPCWFVRAALIGMSIFLPYPSTSLASVDVCQQPSDFSHLTVAYYGHDTSVVDGTPIQIDRENRNVDLQYKMDDVWSLGVGHRYVILGMEPIELQTNGHLHTLFFPVHRQSGSDSKGFRFSIAPSLSASSNVLKNPGEYSADTIQFLGALVWRRELSERVELRYGVCGDHSFGGYKIYPSITIGWRPRTDLMIEMGFPITRVTYRGFPNTSLSLRIAPYGNEWHVKSKDMEKQSQLVFEASLVECAITWHAHKRLAITASVGRILHGQYNVTLLDDSRAGFSYDAITRVGAALELRF